MLLGSYGERYSVARWLLVCFEGFGGILWMVYDYK